MCHIFGVFHSAIEWAGGDLEQEGKILFPSFSVHTLDVSFPLRIAHLCSILSYFRCFSQPLNGPRGAQTWHKKRKMPFPPFWVHFTRRRIFSWGQYLFPLCSTEKVPFLQFVDCLKEIYGRIPQISSQTHRSDDAEIRLLIKLKSLHFRDSSLIGICISYKVKISRYSHVLI